MRREGQTRVASGRARLRAQRRRRAPGRVCVRPRVRAPARSEIFGGRSRTQTCELSVTRLIRPRVGCCLLLKGAWLVGLRVRVRSRLFSARYPISYMRHRVRHATARRRERCWLMLGLDLGVRWFGCVSHMKQYCSQSSSTVQTTEYYVVLCCAAAYRSRLVSGRLGTLHPMLHRMSAHRTVLYGDTVSREQDTRYQTKLHAVWSACRALIASHCGVRPCMCSSPACRNARRGRCAGYA